MSNLYGKGPRGKATRLHSLVVRSRGRCERCGKTEGLECAHIVPRRHAATRTDESNAWCLCHACHRITGERPWEFMDLVARTIGEAELDRLRAKAFAAIKASEAFWLAEIDRLTALLEEAA